MLLGNEPLDQALGGATSASLVPSDNTAGSLVFMQLRAGIQSVGINVDAPAVPGTSASFNRQSAALSAPVAAPAMPAMQPAFDQTYKPPGNG